MTRTQGRLNKAKMEERNTLILDLVEGGHRYSAISSALERGGYGKLSPPRIREIVNSALDEAREARRDTGVRVFDLKLEQLNRVIQTNWGVITKPCVRCKGRGDMGQDPDKAPGTLVVCDKCAGDGKHHTPRDRATASKEVRLAIDQQCKLLGLYAPEKFALTDTEGNDLEFWANETKGLDEDDLNTELEVFMAGVEAARKEQSHIKEASSRGPEEPEIGSDSDTG